MREQKMLFFYLRIKIMDWSTPPQQESTYTSPHSIKIDHTLSLYDFLSSLSLAYLVFYFSLLSFFPILQPRNHMHTQTAILPSFSPPFLKILHCCKLGMGIIKLWTYMHSFGCKAARLTFLHAPRAIRGFYRTVIFKEP